MIRFFTILCVLLTAFFATGASNIKYAHAYAETVIPSPSAVWRFGEEEFILFFENEVAERRVVSNMSDKKRERMTAQYGITNEQLNVLLCLQYALNSIDQYYGLDELSTMTETEILGLALKFYSVYWPLQTPEKQADLSAKLSNIF